MNQDRGGPGIDIELPLAFQITGMSQLRKQCCFQISSRSTKNLKLN